MADPSVLYMPAPHEGLDLSVPPHQLPPTRSHDLLNWLVHEDDRLILRGPALRIAAGSFQTAAGVGSPSAGVGFAVPIEGQLLITPIISSATPKAFPWRQYERQAPQAPDWYDPGRDALYDPIAGTFTNLTTASGAGSRWCHHQGYVWVVSIHAPDNLRVSYQGRLHGVTKIFRHGPLPTSTVVSAGTNGREAPRACCGIASYVERLFTLGGMPTSLAADPADPASGSTFPTTGTSQLLKPHRLYYTNIDADPLLRASWQTAGVTNVLVIGPETSTDYGMGLARLSQALVIFKRHSVWQLTGYGTDSFALRQLRASSGLVDPRAVAVVNDEAYFLSSQGLMRVDGNNVTDVSGRVGPLLRPALRLYASDAGAQSSYATLTVLPDQGYILVSVQGYSAWTQGASFTAATGFQALYHITTGRWTLLSVPVSSATFQDGFPATGVVLGNTPTGFVDAEAYDLSYLCRPEVHTGGYRGKDTYAYGNRMIPARARFAPARLTAPHARAQFARMGAEYMWQKSSDASPLVGALKLTLERYIRQSGVETGLSDTVHTMAALSAYVSGTLSDRPQVQWEDATEEATDVVVRVDRDTDSVSPGTLVRGELLGAMIEAQAPTHRRR